jgi:AcrR family transcriptional regulator
MTLNQEVPAIIRSPAPKRSTFRHGNLPDALLNAALQRIETHGADSITLRDLARDTGVNHRAIYRHFPDKESLLADAAERCWRQFLERLKMATAHEPLGEPMLVAAGVAMYLYGRDNPNHFLFATGAYPSLGMKFPKLEAAITESTQIFAVGFAGTGMAPDLVVGRAAIYLSSMQGVVAQYLHRRLRVIPDHATAWMSDTCALLVRGLK